MPRIARQPSFATLPVIPPERITPLVELNVGGAPYTVPQAALTRFANSDLARWASGALTPPRDQAGRIFVNRDGAGMQALVSYLRGGMPLSAMRDDQLAVLQADGEALGLGPKFAHTVRWERLRRQLEAQPLDLADTARPQPALGRCLDFLAVNEALGLPSPSPDLHAVIQALPGPCAEHCAARVQAAPNDRAVMRQAMLAAVGGEAGSRALDELALARRILEQDPYDMEAQTCWAQMTRFSGPQEAPAASSTGVTRLCGLLRAHAPGGRGSALVARLEREPLRSVHADLTRPEHRDEAIETALLLRTALDKAEQRHPGAAPEARQAAEWMLRYGLSCYAQRLFVETPSSVERAGPDWFAWRVGVVETLLKYRDAGRSLGAHVPLGCFGHAEVEALWDTLWKVYGWHDDIQLLSGGVLALRAFGRPQVAPDLAALTRRQLSRARTVLGALPRGGAEAQTLAAALGA